MDYNSISTPIQSLITYLSVFIPKLITALILFFVMLYLATLAAKLVRAAAQRRCVDPEVTKLLFRLTRWSLIIVGVVWALHLVDFNVTGFLAGLGIAGLTIGFALKDIAENFIAGILLLLHQPFDLGDGIEVAGHSGTVIDIEIRATTIRTWDGLLVIVPNAEVYKNAITNYSKVDKRRIGLDIGVGYETNLQQAHEAMLEAVTGLPGVCRDDPAPTVVFKEFGDSSVNASLYFWIEIQDADYFATIDSAIKGIKITFDEQGINIPYPIRTVYVNQTPP